MLITELRKRFSEMRLPSSPEILPNVEALLKKMEIDEQAVRRAKFYRLYTSLLRDWITLENSDTLKAFKVIRDKGIAHLELKLVDGMHIPSLNIAELGLTWGDLQTVINQLDPIITNLNLVVRDTALILDDFKAEIDSSSYAFWV